MAIAIALIIIMLFSLAATYFVGMFFMSIAIIRKENDHGDFVPAEEKAKKEADKDRTMKNKEQLDRMAEEFLCSSEASNPELIAPDGIKLSASFFPGSSNKAVILVHGYTGSRKEMMSKAAVFHSWGYNVLVPDNRAHGESGGKYIGMGWLDKDDLKLWINWLSDENPESRIVLLGVSMGGAAVMMTAGDSNRNVEAVIEDCGYTSVWDIFADELKSLYHLPSFPILDMCRAMIKLKAKYDIKVASSVNQLRKATVPILFIHGSDDHFVNTNMVYRNYDAKTTGDKDILIVNNAGHAMAEIENPDQYYGKIREFLSKYDL